MANDNSQIRRTLHIRFTLPASDPAHLLSLMQAAAPFWQFLGGKRMQLLQNVDDPGRYIQVIEYETPEAMELNRQRIATDVRFQGYLQAWRAFMPGAPEIDVYRDVET
ncbi:MAG TPA: hypothetical protein VHA77_10820 [Xanthobacteraceae bacterium]|jgi:hypothetical protein|nr:hypothetical protein [Xanthobacteraceae bacterium]